MKVLFHKKVHDQEVCKMSPEQTLPYRPSRGLTPALLIQRNTSGIDQLVGGVAGVETLEDLELISRWQV